MDRDAFAAQQPLAANLDVVLRTPAEVERAEDLREFVRWAESPELDYLREPAPDRILQPA
jgi:hypothetical protein